MRLATGWAIAASMVVSNSSGMVLCIGEDGHMAVEPVHEDHCDHPSDETSHGHDTIAHATAFPFEDDCVDCFDVSLDLYKVSQAREKLLRDLLLKDTVSKILAANYPGGFIPDHHGIRCLSKRAPPRLSQNLITQRTIVLQL